MGRSRVVLDVNVVVSALFGGVPREAVEKAMKETLVLSPPIVAEMFAVTEDLGRRMGTEPRRVFRRYVKQLLGKAEMVEIPRRLQICRDPADDVYLETSLVGRAKYLVSGDRDLVEIAPALLRKHRLGNLAIITPARYLEVCGT